MALSARIANRESHNWTSWGIFHSFSAFNSLHLELKTLLASKIRTLSPFSRQESFIGRADDKHSKSIVTTLHSKANFLSLKVALQLLVSIVYICLTFYLPLETFIIPILVAMTGQSVLIKTTPIFNSFRSYSMVLPAILVHLVSVVALLVAVVAYAEVDLKEMRGRTSVSGKGSWRTFDDFDLAWEPILWVVSYGQILQPT